MPSPFPGMNPFLEQEDAWQDFHQRFMPTIGELLSPQVSPTLVVKLEAHIYIHELEADERRLIGRADVAVARQRDEGGATAVAKRMVAPSAVTVPVVDVERQAYLEVRDRQSRELIAVIELLSRANKKPGADREQYIRKRAEVLHSPAHFVEIDLLRGWGRMPMTPLPDCDYAVLVSRAEERPLAELWPLRLRETLPTIPVPLRSDMPDAKVDLQAALARVYDAAYYADYIYAGAPNPPLAAGDAVWVEQVMRQRP